MKRALILVSGMVHGVGYRSYAKKYASELGLTGFVKNQRDGSVQVVAEGYEKQIMTLAQILRKGPWGAKVKEVKVEWQDPTNEYTEFRIEA